MTTDPEPKDKLDATATRPATTFPVPAGVSVANGLEGEVPDWDAIDWRAVEDDVRRLRQRIFAASQAGDLRKVRNLQKLMLRSRANTLLSVRRVTEVNAGRKTAGIDGQLVRTATAKAELAGWMQHQARLWQARPVSLTLSRDTTPRNSEVPVQSGWIKVAKPDSDRSERHPRGEA